MEKKLFILKDEVCAQNGKTEAEVQKLYEVMTHFGEIKPFEQATKEIEVEYQAIIDNLNAQIRAIKDLELTADEITIVKAYRLARNEVTAKHTALEQESRQTIAKLEETLTQLRNKIIAVLGE